MDIVAQYYEMQHVAWTNHWSFNNVPYSYVGVAKAHSECFRTAVNSHCHWSHGRQCSLQIRLIPKLYSHHPRHLGTGAVTRVAAVGLLGREIT